MKYFYRVTYADGIVEGTFTKEFMAKASYEAAQLHHQAILKKSTNCDDAPRYAVWGTINDAGHCSIINEWCAFIVENPALHDRGAK